MSELTMCGYCCDLCKAYAPNIEKHDQRQQLAVVWNKYYNLDISADDVYCDGCRCNKPGSKRIDKECPVRKCVIDKELIHCGDCSQYPCATSKQREGLSAEDAMEMVKSNFDVSEYNEYLLAYDNKTRMDNYKKGIK